MEPKSQDKPRPDSFVRDHLANVRTFLAWLRTAVAMMGFGIVIVKLRYLSPVPAAPQKGLHLVHLGLLFAIFGLLMVPFSLWHYLATRRAIENEGYRPENISIIVFAIATAAIGIAVVYYLLSMEPQIPVARSPI